VQARVEGRRPDANNLVVSNRKCCGRHRLTDEYRFHGGKPEQLQWDGVTIAGDGDAGLLSAAHDAWLLLEAGPTVRSASLSVVATTISLSSHRA
jgi:hypothetical protein